MKINNINQVGIVKFFLLLVTLYLAVNFAIQATIIIFFDIPFTNKNVSLFSWVSAGTAVIALILHVSRWNVKDAMTFSSINMCSVSSILLALICAVFYVFCTKFMFFLQSNDVVNVSYSISVILDNLFFFFVILIFVPLYEEVLFRGVFFDWAKERFNLFFSSLFLSGLFSVLHLQHFGWMMLSAFALSLVLYFFRWRFNSVLPCFLMHVLCNLLSFIISGRVAY